MADTADDRRDGRIPVSDAELRELLASAGHLRECPSCGHRDWTLLNDAYQISPFLPAQSVEKTKPPQRIDCAVLLCKICGFMQIREQGHLYRLLEELRAKRDAAVPQAQRE